MSAISREKATIWNREISSVGIRKCTKISYPFCMRYDCEMTTDSENDTYATVILGRLAKSPHLLLPVFFAWMRGWGYRIKYFLTRQNFSAGKLFRVYGPMNITGPGQVRFGDNVLIISNAIKPVCIRTLTRVAKVVLGNNTGLNGTS